MKKGGSPLLPLLRSRVQAEILATMLLNPDREWSLTELAHRVGSSVATAQREVQRAEEAGVVRSHRIGNTRLVRADTDGPLTEPLTELLLRSLGPKQVVAEVLADVPGVEAAYLFGSWAARLAGERGRAPQDIDVLVIGEPDRDKLDEATSGAERRLARPVQVTIRRRSWWNNGDDSFRKEISKRPIVEVIAPKWNRVAS
jgi:predicted nucleotidyltransferase